MHVKRLSKTRLATVDAHIIARAAELSNIAKAFLEASDCLYLYWIVFCLIAKFLEPRGLNRDHVRLPAFVQNAIHSGDANADLLCDTSGWPVLTVKELDVAGSELSF